MRNVECNDKQYEIQQECSRQVRDVIMFIHFQNLNGSNCQKMCSYYHANNMSSLFTRNICKVILEMDKHY